MKRPRCVICNILLVENSISATCCSKHQRKWERKIQLKNRNLRNPSISRKTGLEFDLPLPFRLDGKVGGWNPALETSI